MSEKVKQAITKCLKKIDDDTFDEDTIRTLLITSRELIPNEGLIKELAHFIAHPKRDKGIFHKKINSRYAKSTLVSDLFNDSNSIDRLKTIKTNEQLSDFMLSGVSVEKIEARLFDTLYSDGLDDLPESHLKKYTGFTKKEVQYFLKRFYVKQDGYYYIITNRTENLIKALKRLPKSNVTDEQDLAETLSKTESMANKIKTTMDGIQKVIRGVIYYNSVFEPQSFKKEISDTISSVIKELNIEGRYINRIEEQSDKILLCTMTLLHDCKFVFYDKKEAKTFLCFYLDNNFKDTQKIDYNLAADLYEKGVIALYLSGKDIMEFPLFVSDLLIKDFVPYDVYRTVPIHSIISKTDLITAGRVDGALQLTRDETFD